MNSKNPIPALSILPALPATPRQLRVLIVDNDPDDLLTLHRLLATISHCRFEIEEAGSHAAACEALALRVHDLYLLDWHLGEETALTLLTQVAAVNPAAARIVITGAGTRVVDLLAMEADASDYLEKGKFDAQLLERCIRYSLERQRFATEREKLIRTLEVALANVKTLEGLLPICAHCKKIRDTHDCWHEVEVYVRERTPAQFTHTICEACIRSEFPELADGVLADIAARKAGDKPSPTG